MKKINVAVIGCGRIAGHHCRNIKNNSALNLVAVCDLESERHQAYAKEFSVPGYINYRELLEKHPDVEVVAIITPSGMHYEHAKEIVTKYKKHIVVEKPTFLKTSQLDEIYALAKKNSVKVFPVFQNRYNKAVQKVRQSLKNGELGNPQIFSVRVRWCRPQKYYDLSAWRGTFAMDGGAITNQGVHHIDLLRHLGGEVEEVRSYMKTYGAHIEVEDTCVSVLKFKNGAVGTLEITTAARPDDFEASISIVGSKGLAQIGGIAVNELQLFTPAPQETKESSEDFSKCVYGNGHEKLYIDVASDLNGTGQYPVSQEDARNSLSLLHAFYVSSETQKEVKPSPEIESKNLGRADENLAKLYRTI